MLRASKVVDASAEIYTRKKEVEQTLVIDTMFLTTSGSGSLDAERSA